MVLGSPTNRNFNYAISSSGGPGSRSNSTSVLTNSLSPYDVGNISLSTDIEDNSITSSCKRKIEDKEHNEGGNNLFYQY